MTTFWATNATSVTPPSMQMTPGEDLVLSFDTTPLLGVGQTPSAPEAHLYRLDTDAEVTLPAVPTLSGNLVLQRVNGLLLGVNYWLEVLVAIAGNKMALTLFIECVR